LKQGIDIRPSIAVTKAHMRLLEIEKSVKDGRIKVDGKIVLNEVGELAVTKGTHNTKQQGRLRVSCRGACLVFTWGCCSIWN
jgi:hypothetical protein